MCLLWYISELFLSDEAIEQLHDFEEECLDAYFHEGECKQLCSVEERVRLTTERSACSLILRVDCVDVTHDSSDTQL